jgi:hypothetical protein
MTGAFSAWTLPGAKLMRAPNKTAAPAGAAKAELIIPMAISSGGPAAYSHAKTNEA